MRLSILKGSRWRYILTACVLLLYWLLGSSLLRFNLGSKVRFANDDYDRKVYFMRGAWLPNHSVAYRDVFSEYPQVPTALFGLLRGAVLGEKEPAAAFLDYSMIFSGLMLAVLFALVVMVERALPAGRKTLALLLLLPAPLYFSYNRFDVLPALLCLMALVLVRERMWMPVAALLGVATLTKWYPALLVPPILVYMFYQRVSLTRIIAFLTIYGTVCVLILMPTLIDGGVSAVLVPYTFHAARDVGPSALPGLLQPLLDTIPFLRLPLGILDLVVLALQVAPSLGAALVRLDSFPRLLNWMTLTVTAFTLFSRIWSPQWLLWIFPFLILLAETRFDVALTAAYGIVTYIQFPIVYDVFGRLSPQMHLISWLNIALLVLILASLAVRFGRLGSASSGLPT